MFECCCWVTDKAWVTCPSCAKPGPCREVLAGASRHFLLLAADILCQDVRRCILSFVFAIYFYFIIDFLLILGCRLSNQFPVWDYKDILDRWSSIWCDPRLSGCEATPPHHCAAQMTCVIVASKYHSYHSKGLVPTVNHSKKIHFWSYPINGFLTDWLDKVRPAFTEEHLQSCPMKDYERPIVNASYTPSVLVWVCSALQ